MEKNEKDILLQEDLKLVETLVNKEALQNWEQSNQQVPNNYFNAFEVNTIHKIQQLKPQARVINLNTWKRIAIAASFIAIIAVTYLFIPSNSNQLQETTALNIQQIPSEEIADFINKNDWYAEVDWQAEMNNEDDELTNKYIIHKTDSN